MLTDTPNVVHETEVERQHPRVAIPATVHVKAGAREYTYPLLDISAGGFAFDADGHAYRVGKIHRAVLKFSIDPMGMTVPVNFRVCNVDNDSHRIGCAFEDLDSRQIALLRQLIHAYLAGELVSVGDMLTTLSRDNYVRPRGAMGAIKPRGTRSRAVTLTGILFLVGLATFTYAAAKFYDVLFVTHAIAAKVAAPTFAITMPRDGTYFSLIPPDGKVKKGQALGTFQAAMLDVVQKDPGSLHLTPQQLSSLMGETLKGTLSSPCNCTVERKFAMDSQFVNRNQPLMTLLPDKVKPYVLARFHFDNVKDLGIGRTVSFHVIGENHTRYGRISKVRMLPTSSDDKSGPSDLRGLDSSSTVTDVVAQIQPDKPLARSLVGRPVDVELGDPRSAVAGTLGNVVHRVHSLVAGKQ